MSVAGQQIQKVYSEWCVKAAEIILAARVDSPCVPGTPLQKSSSFNLQVPELFNVRSEAIARPEFFQLRTQRSFQVEIYLNEEDSSEEGELLERWTFTFLPAPHPEAQLDRHNQCLIRKLTVVLRTLLFFVRLQPAHGLCRGPAPARYHRFRVEAWPPTRTPLQELVSQDFVTLQSTVGTLRLSVSQRKDMKSFANASPLKGVAAISSQMDKIEMEEGFFAPSASCSSEARCLDKIPEEPEARGDAGEVPESQDGMAARNTDAGVLARSAAAGAGPAASVSSRSSHATPSTTQEPEPGAGAERSVCDSLAGDAKGQGADDLSTIWMSNLPDWGRRRSRSLDGSRGTGTGTSRSVSPEGPSRQPSTGDLQCSGRARAWSGSVSSTGQRWPAESEGEICLLGMSDSEEDKASEDLERNVVASAIMEGGGGAFSTSRIDAAKLGLPDFESDAPPLSRRTSERSQASPRMFSPLIAQLNPFQPPNLDLPEPDPVAQNEEPSAPQDSVSKLVEEMGDLVCQLQQRQELAIVSEEACQEELFHRLGLLREFAGLVP